jgi:hypothetical protein
MQWENNRHKPGGRLSLDTKCTSTLTLAPSLQTERNPVYGNLLQQAELRYTLVHKRLPYNSKVLSYSKKSMHMY